jgi:hypothetical protein
MPLILGDGTSVEFPVDWTMEEADDWRKRAGIPKPAPTDRGRATPGLR